MREIVPISWITEDDFVILSWLSEREIYTTPKVIAFETDISYATVKKRLKALEEHNLLTKPSEDQVPEGLSPRGIYAITDLGKRMAQKDLTIQEMIELEEKGAFDSDGSSDP